MNVWDIRFGYGTVQSICSNGDVFVNFKGGSKRYNSDGRFASNENVSLLQKKLAEKETYGSGQPSLTAVASDNHKSAPSVPKLDLTQAEEAKTIHSIHSVQAPAPSIAPVSAPSARAASRGPSTCRRHKPPAARATAA